MLPNVRWHLSNQQTYSKTTCFVKSERNLPGTSRNPEASRSAVAEEVPTGFWLFEDMSLRPVAADRSTSLKGLILPRQEQLVREVMAGFEQLDRCL